MTPEEREIALRKKSEKQLRKGIITEPLLSDITEPLPEEPAIKPKSRNRTK